MSAPDRCDVCQRRVLVGELLLEVPNGDEAPWWVCTECLQEADGGETVDRQRAP